MAAKLVNADQGAPQINKATASKVADPAIATSYSELNDKGKVSFWLSQIDQRSEDEKRFVKDGETTIKVYRGGTGRSNSSAGTQSDVNTNISRFNILAANVAVLAPATYSATPRPDVRRRFADADPVGKWAAEVLERALEYTHDEFDVDHEVKATVLDMLLPGRGTCRVMYEADTSTVSPGVKLKDNGDGTFTHTNGRILAKIPDGAGWGFVPDGAGPQWTPVPGEPEQDTGDREIDSDPSDADQDVAEWYLGGTPYPHVESERAWFEHVHWQDFKHGDARTWGEVPWVAFRHTMTREQLRKLPISKTVADSIPLDYDTRDDTAQKGQRSQDAESVEQDLPFKRAIVWEIWYKDDKKVIFVAPSHKDAPLFERDPDIRFGAFYPTPRPLMAIENPDDLTPAPEYYVYKGLAEELNRAIRRLQKIISALKARGIYAGAIVDFERVFKADDNELIPSTTAMPMLQGGAQSMSDLVWMVPVDKLITVVEQLYQYVQNVKQTIYEITGISDIARGASNPHETLGAQQLKVQFASIRIQERQQNVQRFVRDLVRMEADVICQMFAPETLADITGIKLPTAEEKAIGKQAAQALAMHTPPPNALASIEVPPDTDLTEYLKRPTWDMVMKALRSTITRTHKIDIETDSTIATDQGQQQDQITKLISAMVQFFEGVSPFVQTPANPAGILPPEAAKTILMAAVRRFGLGTEVEEALDMIGSTGTGTAGGPAPGAPAAPMPAPLPPPPPPPDPVEIAKVQMQGQKNQVDAQLHAREIAVKEGALALDQQRFQLDTQKFQAEEAERVRQQAPMADIHGAIVSQISGAASVAHNTVMSLTGQINEVAQQLAGIGKEVSQIAAEIDAPAEILRDGGGNMIGVKKGNRVRTVRKGKDGRPQGLN